MAIRRPIFYNDIAAEAKARGFEAVPELIGEIIREHFAFLVIDSFKALRDMGEGSPGSARSLRSGRHARGLRLHDAPDRRVRRRSRSDARVCRGRRDLHLVNQKHGVRDERFLRVVKLRGSGFRLASTFRIEKEGLSVFPRLVTPDRPSATP